MEKTEIRSSPNMSAGYGYYGYRAGMYGAWSGYPYDVETTNYRQGTLTIDVVDAGRKALVWQGVAEGARQQEGHARIPAPRSTPSCRRYSPVSRTGIRPPATP